MYFLLDIGGTHLRASISDGEKLLRKKVVDTPSHFDNAVHAISMLRDELCEGESIEKTVCGVAGLLEKNKESLYFSPNLLDWNGKPLKESLSNIFKTDVFLENDAALAGLGEATYGAGKDYPIVAYYTIGTGIGGARIVNGKVDNASYGFEPGHQIIAYDEKKEDQESLEFFGSGSGITKRTGKNPDEIDDPQFWDSVSRFVAVGVFNTILHWSPDVFIFGGGIINGSILSVQTIQKHLLTMPKQYPDLPEIKKSQLGDESGLFGALALAKEKTIV